VRHPICQSSLLLAGACFCLAIPAGCGGSGHRATDTPLAAIPNPSRLFGAQLSRVCEGVYWQLQRYYADRSRAGVDQTLIIHSGVVRLKSLRAPNGEGPALGQLLDAFDQIEHLSADDAAGSALTFQGFLESEKAVTRAMRRPVNRVVVLSKRMLAPGCVDVVVGRSWRHRRTGGTA
jgi:hypothetical protein